MRALDETGRAVRCLNHMRLAILVALVACDAPPPETTTTPTPPAAPAAIAPFGSAEVMATLERTACYGWCPIYKLTVRRDGRVEYSGDEYVKIRGSANGQLTMGQVAELDRAFSRAHYFDLADTYTKYDATDAPSVKSSYRLAGRTKSIEHYGGDMHAPEALSTLEESIDSIVGVEQWIGTQAEREAHARDWRSP